MNVLAGLVMAVTALGVLDPQEVAWGGAAELAYETGFVKDVRRAGEGAVSLFNMELIENDAAGAGISEKGVHGDMVWGERRARKVLRLDDPRAERAFIVIFAHNSDTPPYPLRFEVNGEPGGQITKDNNQTYRWVEFPVALLKKGDNILELFCPEATTEEEGWDLYLSRADEYEAGGGNPTNVGNTSFRSDDGGDTWKESPFGPDGKTRAEYGVRLSLDRYKQEGSLVSPVIDLWRGDGEHFYVPMRQIETVRFEVDVDLPDDTRIAYYVRRGTDPSPYGGDWTPYEKIGGGEELRYIVEGDAFVSRYVQLRAELTTANPLVSPIVHNMRVGTTFKDAVDPLTNLYVVHADNPAMRYPSVNWEWEDADRPEFEELRQRENLDEVIAGSRNQFQAQVKLMDHATKRWRRGGPMPDYPAWDALSILDRIDKTGSGGMCIQGNNFLGGLCMAYGWQARLVNITAHETCEVWNDDYGKWIYLDGYYVNHYNYDEYTGEPMSILEMHNRYLDTHYPNSPIDWMNDTTWKEATTEDYSVGLGVGGHRQKGHDGISLAAFARMVPRNNWYEKPYPRPLSHGSSWWPWDGYINWYDERTPPKRQYSNHTDRKQDMWPDLNRVRVHATSSAGNDRLFLRFESYTPNFSHYEINVDDTGWKEIGEHYAWLLQSGRNHLRARAVNKLGAKGKPSDITLNRTDELLTP
jgi:hypothetical protein